METRPLIGDARRRAMLEHRRVNKEREALQGQVDHLMARLAVTPRPRTFDDMLTVGGLRKQLAALLPDLSRTSTHAARLAQQLGMVVQPRKAERVRLRG